jgi:hypothetical protein
MPSRPSSLPGPLVVLAAPVLVLPLLLPLGFVASLTATPLLGCFSSTPGGSDAGRWRLLLNLSPLDPCIPVMPA